MTISTIDFASLYREHIAATRILKAAANAACLNTPMRWAFISWEKTGCG